MINIKQSSTKGMDLADVEEKQLIAETLKHNVDVSMCLNYFINRLANIAHEHDDHKLSTMPEFLEAMNGNFEDPTWFTKHMQETRHHLNDMDGVPDDVNLLDVLEYIADCVTAGKARSGKVYPAKIPSAVLAIAFTNTFNTLNNQVVVVEDEDTIQ